MPQTHTAHAPSLFGRAVSFTGGLFFAGSIGYFLWFYLFGLESRVAEDDAVRAMAVDSALFILFALHHSVFARTRMRVWIARAVSPYLERTVYVWIASVMFAIVCALWVPSLPIYWDAHGAARVALRALQAAGIVFTLWAAQALDSLSLAGIRQLDHPLPPSGVETSSIELQHTGPYGVVRHPIYLGWLLIVWPAPAMTLAHLLFAAISTAYLIVATVYEEKSLRETFGAAYDVYAARVPKKMIPWVY